jgi:hypothetical protein
MPGQNLADGNYGYVGGMRLPDGRLFDMSHVLCQLDWKANADKRPKITKLPGIPFLRWPNPIGIKSMGLTYDLGTSITAYEKAGSRETTAEGLSTHASSSNLRGDIYGLVLAKELGQIGKPGGPASAADLLDQFFTDPPPSRQIMETFARDYSSWIKESGSGANEDFSAKKRALWGSSLLMSVLSSHGRSLFGAFGKTSPILNAFSAWMDREARGQNPLDNSVAAA